MVVAQFGRTRPSGALSESPQRNTVVPLSAIAIRDATIDDAAAISGLIRPLAEKFIAQEYSAVGARNLLASMTPEEIAARIADGFRYSVAEMDGVIAGAIAIRNNSHLYHLFVAESAQGRGVARALWEAAREETLRRGNPGRITVNSSRFAIPVYERFGFVADGPVQTLNEVVYYPMVWVDDATPPEN